MSGSMGLRVVVGNYQPGVYVPPKALFLVIHKIIYGGYLLSPNRHGDNNRYTKCNFYGHV